MDLKLYNKKGEEAGKINLPTTVFDVPVKNEVVRQVILAMMANERAGTAHTKFRDEVSGTGKKPWKQKGTGNARHGSKRSPIWVGGGISHGPRSEKDYSQKINNKQKLRALTMVLSQKVQDHKVIAVDNFELDNTKTKEAMTVLQNLANKVDGFSTLNTKKNPNNVLLVLPEENALLRRACRNIPFVQLITVRNLNPLQLSKTRYLVFANAENVISKLSERIENGLAKKAL